MYKYILDKPRTPSARPRYDGSGGEVSGDFEEESDGAKSVLAALLMNLLDKEVVSFLEVWGLPVRRGSGYGLVYYELKQD